MPPSRRSRRSNNTNNLPQAPAAAAASDVTYKKGDIVEFQLNGTAVTGRLVKKATNTSSGAQLWVVSPSDRRRKNETVSELDFHRYVDDDNITGTVNRKSYKSGSSQGSKCSDENSDKLKSTKSTTSSDENSNGSSKKRKSDDIVDNGKKVTFQEQKKKKKPATNGSIRVGTRSTRNSNQELFDVNQQPPPLRKKNTLKKMKSNENVTVVQLLTGTLYLYRGETRRAEFVRSKY